MDENPIAVYRARTAIEANLLKDRLGEQGIRAIVTNDMLEGGRGVDLVGWPTDARILVAAADAERARQAVAEFEAEQARLAEQPLEESGASPWAWPICPECDSQRTTTCPGCGRSGTDFAPGDRAPHAEGEGQEAEAPVLICPTCDEPFSPKYLPRCEWCGHEFEPSAQKEVSGEPEPDESTNLRLLAVMAVVVLLAGGVAAYLWFLFR
jgi:hypothetical protein